MSKNALLIAASAAAILASGSATAAEIAGKGTGLFSGISSTTTASAAFKLAEELRFYTSASTSATATQVALAYDFSAVTSFPINQQLLLTLDVGNAIFSTSTGVVITGTGTCNVASAAAASGVVANGVSATYLVTLTGTCAGAAHGISISLPIQATGAGDVTGGALLQSSFGNQTLDIDGGKKTALFIDLVDTFKVTTSAGGQAIANVSASGGAYTGFTGSPAASTAVLTIDTASHTTLANTSTFASTSDVTGVRFRANTTGSFAGFNISVTNGTSTATGTAVTATEATLRTAVLSTATAATTTFSVSYTDNTSTATSSAFAIKDAVIADTDVTLTVDVDLAANDAFGATSTGNFIDFSVGPNAIAGVDRNGTSFIAPWIALNSTTQGSSIRIGNNGGSATGPIQVSLLSDNGAGALPTASVTILPGMLQAGTLNGQGGVDAGDVITISARAVATAAGWTAANGDLQIAIEGVSSTISGKVRTSVGATSQIFETSLGNLSVAP